MGARDDRPLDGAIRAEIEATAEGDQAPDLFADKPLLELHEQVAEGEGGQLVGIGEPVRRGPGRPAGSRNRRTARMVDYILARYRSPLLGMAEICNAPVRQLAAALGCSLLDALKVQQTAQRDLAPYLHQKQPTAIDVNGAAAGALIISVGQTIAAPGASPHGLPMTLQEGQQNQGVIDDAQEVSDDEKSDDG